MYQQMSIDCIWLNTNVSSCCLGIISTGWEIVTQQLPPLWQVDKFSLPSTAAFLPERISLYPKPGATSCVQHAFHWAWLHLTADVERFYQATAQMSKMLFLYTSETPPNICCSLHFGRDPAILWMLPGPACNAKCNAGTTGTEKSFGVFLFNLFVTFFFVLLIIFSVSYLTELSYQVHQTWIYDRPLNCRGCMTLGVEYLGSKHC